MQQTTDSSRILRARARKRKRKLRRIRIGIFVLSVLAISFFWGWRMIAAPQKSDNADKDNGIQEETSYHSNNDDTAVGGSSDYSANRGAANHNTDNRTLILVNQWNKIPDNYDVTPKQLINGHAVDERCYPDLQQMMDDCRAAGLSPLICSSYRTKETQQQLFNNKIDSLIAQGYSNENAESEAAKAVAVPGTSEHQLGLAVDIVDIYNQNLDSFQEQTDVQQWLLANSWKYGFILRYPSDKSNITGIEYEPWHYRYVGKDAAREIYEQGICLEEYLNLLRQ